MCIGNLASVYSVSVKRLKFPAYIQLSAAVCLSCPNIRLQIAQASYDAGRHKFWSVRMATINTVMRAVQRFKDFNVCFKLVNIGHVLRKALI